MAAVQFGYAAQLSSPKAQLWENRKTAHRQLQHPHLLAPAHKRDVGAGLRYARFAQRQHEVALRHLLHSCTQKQGEVQQSGWQRTYRATANSSSGGSMKSPSGTSSTAAQNHTGIKNEDRSTEQSSNTTRRQQRQHEVALRHLLHGCRLWCDKVELINSVH